jgi:hypothetical protein
MMISEQLNANGSNGRMLASHRFTPHIELCCKILPQLPVLFLTATQTQYNLGVGIIQANKTGKCLLDSKPGPGWVFVPIIQSKKLKTPHYCPLTLSRRRAPGNNRLTLSIQKDFSVILSSPLHALFTLLHEV